MWYKSITVGGSDGRFKQRLPSTEARRKKSVIQKNYCARLEVKKKKLFDCFIKHFFIGGTDDDWIPISSSSGPLVRLPEILLKESYVLEQNTRSEKVVLFFFGGDPRKVKKITHRISTRDAAYSDGPMSRILAFKGRRLPMLANHSTEIQSVKGWIDMAFTMGALRKGPQESFSDCVSILNTYVSVRSKQACIRWFPEVETPNTRDTKPAWKRLFDVCIKHI